MILVDANVLMYAAGAAHPHKRPSLSFLERVARSEIDAAIDAEALQEILYRYRAIDRWADGRRVYDLARRIFPTVFEITADATDIAKALMDENPALVARDALHAAVVQLHELEAICSYDSDFDVIEALRRLEPPQV